jgi:hypothetical protein
MFQGYVRVRKCFQEALTDCNPLREGLSQYPDSIETSRTSYVTQKMFGGLKMRVIMGKDGRSVKPMSICQGA